jgi:hypothetical protein
MQRLDLNANNSKANFKEFSPAMDRLSEAPEHVAGMYRFEDDVLWITLRDCKTLNQALRPFERAMKNPKFQPGQKVNWDLTLQHTVLSSEETSRGIKWSGQDRQAYFQTD